MTAWQEHAAEVARCWARPRVGGFPPSASLAYMAEKAYWQASNMCGFTGSLDDWIKAVEAALVTPAPAPGKPEAAVPAPVRRAEPEPEPKPTPASSSSLGDIEEWLKS